MPEWGPSVTPQPAQKPQRGTSWGLPVPASLTNTMAGSCVRQTNLCCQVIRWHAGTVLMITNPRSEALGTQTTVQSYCSDLHLIPRAISNKHAHCWRVDLSATERGSWAWLDLKGRRKKSRSGCPDHNEAPLGLLSLSPAAQSGSEEASPGLPGAKRRTTHPAHRSSPCLGHQSSRAAVQRSLLRGSNCSVLTIVAVWAGWCRLKTDISYADTHITAVVFCSVVAFFFFLRSTQLEWIKTPLKTQQLVSVSVFKGTRAL